MYPSFATYMERCLYDDESGYYGSGRVEFGGEPHYWTYPRLLSPIFGWALAERIRETAACWIESGLLTGADRFTILELGGGDGCLARDVLDYVVARALEPGWRQFAGRIEYVIGEVSPSLRNRQEHNLRSHIDAGRARVVDCDARVLSWVGSFTGIVLCNELIDALPVERLRVFGADQSISRVHVKQFSEGNSGSQAEEIVVALSAGWMNEDGVAKDPPTALLDYLLCLDPLIKDLDACELLPVDLYWQPSLPEFVRRLSELLTKPGNFGTALLVDYGGTSRHVLDPRSSGSHLRVYSSDRELAHATDVYTESGIRDITCDVDFTEVARLARGSGLDVSLFSHQSAIDTGRTPHGESEKLDALGARLSRDVGYAPSVARLVAPYVMRRFRRSPCYWLMQLSPPHIPPNSSNSAVEMLPDGKALWTLASSVGGQQLETALDRAGLPQGIAGRLKSCGDIAADMSDAGMLEHYSAVVALLESHGWLRSPGAAGT